MRTDDMVREALADLAPTAPADNTAMAGVRRAIGRRRRRRHVAQAVAAVALVATAVGTGALMLRAEDSHVQTGDEPSTTSPTTSPSTETTKPSTETTETTTGGSAADRTAFGPVSFVLPDGWEIIFQREEPSTDLVNGGPGPTGETMCIAPVDASGAQVGIQWDGCSGLMIHQGDFLPGNEMDAYQPDARGAWDHHTDTNPCPNNPGNPDDGVTSAGGPDGNLPVDGGLRDVGDHRASYNRWRAICQVSGFTFEPQAWYLPTSKVLIFDVFGHNETEAFLASFEFNG